MRTPRSCPPPNAAARPSALGRELVGLLAATDAGDRAAFAEFYRRTGAQVYGLALRIMRGEAAAADLTQEVYLAVWARAGEYDPRRSSPIGWLLTLTHRLAVQRVRDAAACEWNTAYPSGGRGQVAVTSVPEQTALDRADCLDTLTPTQRDALTLTYYRGRTYREAAGQLGQSLPVVRIRLRDGLHRLEKCSAGVGADG